MKVLSLFSGIGGFDLAFERAGAESVSVCEIDKNAQSVLCRHFPKSELFDDVRKVGKETHERKSIDVICGGFPCQDLSIAGKRAGLAGERSGLWFEFARVIDELEPQWVVIENVPGLLSSNKGRDFAVIIRWLAQRGYGVVWRVLDAQYFGVPQRRRRVFIVASFGSGRAAEVLFESKGLSGDTPQSREAGKEVAFTLGTNTGSSSNKGDGGINKTLIIPTIGSKSSRNGGDCGDNLISFNWQAGSTVDPGFHDKPNLIANQTLAVMNISSTVETKIHSRMKPEQVLYSKKDVRRLTPTECERLQGFPDGWTDGQSDTARYKQLGNAVAVPVVEWIARRIVCIERNSGDE